MTFADKLIEERKKLGLSQEELAEKLSISRQAVSKWESAQAVPDLPRILALAALFSVTTDYLLKDDLGSESRPAAASAPEKVRRRVSSEEASAYLSAMKTNARTVALGVLLCVLCPTVLIALIGLAAAGIGGITKTVAVAVGMIVLFLLIVAAVSLFIRYAGRIEPFDYLEKEDFETAYGVDAFVREEKAAYAPTYTRYLSLGIALCVLSPLPLILTAILNKTDGMIILMTAVLLCIVAVGVYMIVRVAMVQSSYQTLLQEGEYSPAEKENEGNAGPVSVLYWNIVLAGYLTWSFISRDWGFTWIVWPIAAVLFVPFKMIAAQFHGKKR